VLTVTVFTSGPGLAIGMPITGAGVSANTRITGSSATDGTLTGYNSTGTYRVNNSQTVGSESMVSAYGPDWLLPTTTEAGAGLQFINCGSVAATRSLTLATVFTALPGEAGSSTNMHKIVGDQFTITDGAKSGGGAAAFGDATQGGGSQIIKVWWNGTSWIRNG
jgi:hypothetical protein